MSESEAFRSLAFILGSAALVPIVLGLLPKVRLPEVVLLLALGMTIGPYGLGLAAVDSRVGFVSDLGLGMLFLLAGIEVDPLVLRTRDGGKARDRLAGLARRRPGLDVPAVEGLRDLGLGRRSRSR